MVISSSFSGRGEARPNWSSADEAANLARYSSFSSSSRCFSSAENSLSSTRQYLDRFLGVSLSPSGARLARLVAHLASLSRRRAGLDLSHSLSWRCSPTRSNPGSTILLSLASFSLSPRQSPSSSACYREQHFTPRARGSQCSGKS